MPKLTIVVGLPGSGKTTFLQSRRETANAFRRRLGRVDDELIEALRSGRDCVADDTRFCHPGFRRDHEAWIREQVPEVEIEWFFIDKDVDACMHNLVYDAAHSDASIAGLRSRARSFFDCLAVYELPLRDEYPPERILPVVRAELAHPASASTPINPSEKRRPRS